MKFLINELNKYVDISDKTNEDLTKLFTSLAFEVEEVIPANIISGVKLTKVLECSKHPNADTLSYLTTNINNKPMDVVCGGKNISKDQIVAHAIPGSKVGDLQLKPKELRGILSNGMILSISEIMGISKKIIEKGEEHNIFVFDKNVDMNKSISNILEIDGDIYDLSILPDRQYAASYFTMAREIASFLERDFNWKINDVPRNGDTNISLELGDKANALFVTNVVLKKSKTPFFIKRILYISGIKPTNTIKDIIAYVMLMTGSVVYVMDRSKSLKLNGRKLNDIDLFNSDVLLTEKDEVMFVSQSSNSHSNFMNEKKLNVLFGGRNIKGSTTESAKLSSMLIIDIANKAGFLEKASKTTSKYIDKSRKFELSDEYIFNYLGNNIDISKTIKKLNSIGIKKEGNKYTIPSYRKDIKYKADIIEEIARFYGIENIKPKPYSITKDEIDFEPHKNALINITDELTKYGMVETKTYELITNEQAKKYNIWNMNKFVELTSDYSLEFNTLQTSLLSGLIDSFVLNHKNDKEDIRLFELSNVFHNEKPIYSLGIIHDEKIVNSNEEPILATKEFVMKALESINVDLSKISFKTKQNISFNPYVSSEVFFDNKSIGLIGEIHPSILRENKLIRLDKVKAKLYYAEIKIEDLF